ncbi:Clathrin heavy chain 1 [Trichinella papuae]|uniref:Clathrin heavy chain 1 n=1 Tax=Trichinella papuae TaxID=268474 RepID=A0A0V1MFK4_9BILA|nr:Clathrin heavy chain 1 [Trichinella papuae]
MQLIPHPIKILCQFKLGDLGIDESKVDFSTVSLQSDKYVCFRDEHDYFTSLYVVYGEKYTEVCYLKNLKTCKFALMNPSLKIIAIIGKQNLEIWDLQTKTPRRYFDIINNPLIFYKWIDINNILILTYEGMLLSWNIENNEVKHMFKLKYNFYNCEISDILIDSRCEWFLIIEPHITKASIFFHLFFKKKIGMKLSSMMLLCNIHQQKTELYSAVTACFLHFKPNANAEPCTLLCILRCDSFYNCVIQIENLSKHGCSFVKKAISFSFPHGRRDDFPVAMQANDKYGILFVMTSYGYLHVFDVNESICLYEGIFTNSPIVSSTAYMHSGIVCVNDKGHILTAVVDEKEIISCLCIALKNKSTVLKFARRCNFPGAEGLFACEFWELCNNGEYYKAAELAAIIHMDALATEKIIEHLQTVKMEKGERNPVFLYFKRRLENGQLNDFESFKLCELVLQRKRKNLVKNWMKANKAIKFCYVALKNWAICSKNMTTIWHGQRIYEPVAILRLNAIECLAEKYQLNSAALTGNRNCTKHDYISVFQQTVTNQNVESSQLLKCDL